MINARRVRDLVRMDDGNPLAIFFRNINGKYFTVSFLIILLQSFINVAQKIMANFNLG